MTENQIIAYAEDAYPDVCAGLKTTLFEAIGEASTCWDNLTGAGVFDSTRAAEVGDRLYAAVLAAFLGVDVR